VKCLSPQVATFALPSLGARSTLLIQRFHFDCYNIVNKAGLREAMRRTQRFLKNGGQ
jgi:hypothetical protein